MPAPIAEGSAAAAEREQKITPFEVEGGVDADGKSTGMCVLYFAR